MVRSRENMKNIVLWSMELGTVGMQEAKGERKQRDE